MAFPSSPEEMLRRMEAQSPMLAAMFNNPDPASREAAWRDYEEYERANAEERERTGETEDEQMMREKREWAEDDAKSAKLKDDGNAAFKDGDFKTAYAIYTACMHLSSQEPLYPLNRAAVALSERSYRLFTSPLIMTAIRTEAIRNCS